MALNDAFLDLIEYHENDIVNFILEDGALHNGLISGEGDCPDARGSTILHHAAEHDNKKLVYDLLEKGVPVDVLDSTGNTPLMWAIRTISDYEISALVECLLEYGADVELKNQQGLDSLDLAFKAWHKTSAIVKLVGALKKKYPTSEALAERLMTRYGCGINEAVFSLDARVIEYMIEQGVSVETVHPLRSSALPALHRAVELVQVDIVKLLLDFGADPDEAWRNGIWTYAPISFLYQSDFDFADHHGLRHEILNSLLRRRVALTSRGKIYVSGALQLGSPDVVRDILQSPIDFTANGEDEETLLRCLVINRNTGVFEIWKEHIDKFDLNASPDKWGCTVLDSAVVRGNLQMVEFLLGHGVKAGDHELHRVYTWFGDDIREEVLDECAIIFLQENINPQVIFAANPSGEAPVDEAKRRRCFVRINSAIAQLAILERRGEPVSEATYSKINADSLFKKYFAKCRRILQTEVAGFVTVFQLLTENDRKMARYLGNEELLSKLNLLDYKQSARSRYPYYYKVLERRFSSARKYRHALQKASWLIYEISGERLDADSLATERIIDFLSDSDLESFLNLVD